MPPKEDGKRMCGKFDGIGKLEKVKSLGDGGDFDCANF
jgi:hypothetical protein